MDKDRQIRFLYAPIVVGLYLLWGWLSVPAGQHALCIALHWLKEMGPAAGAVVTAALGGSLTLAIGFLLGTMSYLLLRVCFCLDAMPTHEIPPWPHARKAIWWASGLSHRNPSGLDIHMAAVWLDFEDAPVGVHEWIVRRWNAFNVPVNISVGVSICLFFGLVQQCSRRMPCIW